MKWKLKYSILALIIGFSGNLFAEESTYPFSESKQIKKGFKAVSGADLHIENKYGDITINNWDKDSIILNITIKSEGDDIMKVKEKVDAIVVKIDGNSNGVTAMTDWSDGYGVIKRSLEEIKQSVSNAKIHVDYTVYVPKSVELHIDNSFGHVRLDNVHSELELFLNHGDLAAYDINDDADITVKYGDIRCGYVKDAKIEHNFGNLKIEKADKLRLSTIKSDISIQEIDRLVIDSKNDEIEIEAIKDLTGSFMLSDVEIDKLIERCQLTTKFGSVEIDEIGQNCKLFKIVSAYTDIEIDESPNSKFTVVMDYGKSFNYGSNIKIESENGMDKIMTYGGTIGSCGSLTIDIYSKNGRVVLD